MPAPPPPPAPEPPPLPLDFCCKLPGVCNGGNVLSIISEYDFFDALPAQSDALTVKVRRPSASAVVFPSKEMCTTATPSLPTVKSSGLPSTSIFKEEMLTPVDR